MRCAGHRARRSLALALLLAVGIPVLGASPATAASTFTVNGTADLPDATLNGVCAAAGGACTLRAAVQEANNTTGATIVVPAGAYLLASGSNDTKGDLDLRRPMTITGAAKQPGAAATTINAGGTERVVEVFGTGTTISGVVLTNGVSNSSGSPGGAIRVNSGAALTLVDSSVTSSQSNDGGGIANGGTLTVERSTVSGNTASSKGGGIYSTGPLTVRNSTISGNNAKFGGGLRTGAASTITAVTITGNNGSNDGGGIERGGGTTTLRMTVVAGNTSPMGPDCVGPLTLALANHIGNTASCSTSGPAPTTGNAELGALADNTGPTRTHLPASTSPLLNKVTPANCGVAGGVDQRGVTRPSGTGCDIGAVELVPAVLTVDVALDAAPDTIGAGIGTLPVENIPPDLLVDVTRVDSDLGASGLSRFGLSRFGLSRFPMEDSGLSRFGLSRFGLSRFGLSRFGLSRFLLSDVPVDGSWEAVLAPEYAPNPVPPLTVLTLADVIEFQSVQALTLGQIDLGATGLGEIPVVDFAFDGLDLERIPPTDDPALQDPTHDLDDERLAAWCVLLGTEACQRSGVDPDPTDTIPPNPATSDATMMTVSINSASLDSTGLSRFGLSRFGLSRFGLSRFAVFDAGLSRFVIEDMVLADIELADLDLDAIDIDPAGLSRFGLSRFGLSRFGDSLNTIVDCTKVDCNDPDATLGDAVDAGALRSATSAP